MYSTAVESEAARDLSPAIAWPTLGLAAALLSIHAALLILGVTNAVSPWLLTVPLGVVAYLSYTPAHEAIHRNIVRSRRFDRLNRAVGWWSALSTGMTWPLLLRTHLAHHAHTNDPARDPDSFVQGPLWRLFALAALSVFTNLVPVPVWRLVYSEPPSLGYLDAWKVMKPAEWRQHQIVHGIMCGAVWTAIFTGHGPAVFALVVLPQTIGRLLMGIFLSWLPHAPFFTGDRYQATLLRRGRLLGLLTMGHSLHLVHHLWPRVPFYRYARLHQRLSPLLYDRGVRMR